MSSLPLAWTSTSQPEAEIDSKVVPPEFDRQRGEWFGAFDGSGGEHIDRLIVGGFVNLRLDDRPIAFDPEVEYHTSEVLLGTHPVLLDPSGHLPQVVGEGEIRRIQRQHTTAAP